MSEPKTHPSSEELSAFSLGQLPPETAVLVEEHVSKCDTCCETIVSLSSDDTFVALLQEVDPAATSDCLSGGRNAAAESVPEPLKDHSRYAIEKLVGRGGMGQVYKARHRVMDRAVALKVIHREWVQRQEAIDRFRREVKTAASLDHPNIVTAYDAEQAGGLHFLAMEFVDGVDLAQAVQKQGPLPVSKACDFIRQAAEGLQYAHQRGMVHRDIKPHNLIVTTENVVKILDFGLASLAPQASVEEPLQETASGDLTIAGAIMGTPDFISPEQAIDARKVDGRSDIYSLGMTLYYLLSGRVPFEEGTALGKLKQHAESEPTPLNEIRDEIPTEVQKIVEKMTAKDPANRYQSPAEIAEALQPFVISTTDTLESSHLAPNQSKSTGWGWWPQIAAASLIVMMITGAAMLPSSFFGFSSPTPPDEVHASLGELDSYIAAMMDSPHNLVFLNVGEIGPSQNYLTLTAIQDGIELGLPAFPANASDKRQSGFIRKFKQVAAELSLASRDESETANGVIEGVNVTLTVTGNTETVTQQIRQVVEETFAVDASEECEYVFRNLPSESSGKIGTGPKKVSAKEFIAEHASGKRVYFGEVNNWIYLVPQDRQAEKQFQQDPEVWFANINELPAGFAKTIRQGNDPQVAVSNKGLSAEDLVAKFEGAHENEVAMIATAICEAAGIPNEQWLSVAKSPTGSTEKIEGKPLSLVLLTDPRFFKDGPTQPDFRYLGERIPKPNDLSGAMSLSTANGYYSLLQPQYLTDLTYEVSASDPDSVNLTGRVHFNGLGLYAGQVRFLAKVDSDLNVQVTGFTLPTHGIEVSKENDTDLWAQSELSEEVEGAFSEDYDLSLVPARAAEIYGFCPNRLARTDIGRFMDKLSDSILPIAVSLDRRLEQALWTKLPEETGQRDQMIGILTVAEGTSVEFAEAALGPDLFADYDGEVSWQELSKQEPLGFDRSRCFQIVDEKTLLIGSWNALEFYQQLWRQPRDPEFLASTTRLNKKEHQVFVLARTMEQKYLKRLAEDAAKSPQLSFLMQHVPIVTDSDYFGLTLSLEEEPRLELVSRFANNSKQGNVSNAMRGLAKSLVKLMETFPASSQRSTEDGAPQLTNVVKTLVTTALGEAKVTEPSEQESRLTVSIEQIKPQLQPYIEEMLSNMSSRRQLYDAVSRNNLRMIAMGFILFEDEHGYFPSIKTKIPGAKYPVSWRVAILPYIGEEQLYNNYQLDQEWNSPANRSLLEEMPDIYRHPTQKNLGNTNYVTIAGQATLTGDGEKPHKIEDLGDSPTSTILVSETLAHTPWLSPEDPILAPEKPLPELGGSYPDGYQVAMADGSVQTISSETSPDVLRAMMTWDGGETILRTESGFELR